MRELANEELKLSIAAATAEWNEIACFQLTLDCYETLGSFEACAANANARNPHSLTELRICLYFKQRRWRHFGKDPDSSAMAYIRNLIIHMRAQAESAQLT